MNSKSDSVLPDWLVFTDLDGTLLDEQSYSYQQALPSIDLLKSRDIPIIFCTSKTAAEVIPLRRELNISAPFIVENGSALFYDASSIIKTGIESKSHPGLKVKVLGRGRQSILDFLKEIKKRFSLPCTGFSEMTIKQIMQLTGLNESEALLAATREFSEPIILQGEFDLGDISKFAAESGFRLLRGNRFYHLLGNSDKGKAVNEMTAVYHSLNPEKQIKTIGLGDSPNDIEMLQKTDYPVLVRKSEYTGLIEEQVPGLIRTKATGPAGWCEAIMEIFSKK